MAIDHVPIPNQSVVTDIITILSTGCFKFNMQHFDLAHSSFFGTLITASVTMARFFLLFLSGASLAAAFVPQNLVAPAASKTTHSRLNAAQEMFAGVLDMDTSRVAFFTWFFGASGGAGLARSAFPRMYDSVQTIKKLKGEGPTLGGETLGLSPLCGYPQDLSVADVTKILNNKLNVEQIVKKYPVEGNFLSASGYLTFKAFQDANKDKNPLAVRAIFDTLSSSTDVCAPDIAQEKFDSFKANTSLVASELLKSKLLGFSSIFTLLFLLGLADYEAFGHAYHGWFPEWPGITNFPASFFDDLGAIPHYWISETSQ